MVSQLSKTTIPVSKTKMPGISHAIILAAGFGTRLRPLTLTTPKPLVKLRGKPLIDWAFDRLEGLYLKKIIVNTHYLHEQIEAHFKDNLNIQISQEHDILETGGGVKKALPFFEEQPFLAINSDSVWLDGPTPALKRIMNAWDPKTMDVLFMVYPTAFVKDYGGQGDFFVSPMGQVTRRQQGQVATFVHMGIQILNPKLFKDTPTGAWSLNLVYDKAIKQKRAFGLIHDGQWFHIGTPQSLEHANQRLKKQIWVGNIR